METGQARTTSVWEAMDRALSAEREARDQIESCRGDANRILGEARDREQKIRENTQRRIQRVHDAAQKATASRIRAMRREAAEKMAVIDYAPSRSDAVARAAASLAEQLTSRRRGD